MEEAAAPVSLIFENDRKGEYSAMWENHISTAINVGFYSLPRNLHHIVASYVSDDNGDPNKCALLGEQRIALCLSQHANLELGFCWHFGCLTPEDRLETSMKVGVDKKCIIRDYQSFLDVFSHKNSLYYSIVVEVLVLQLDMPSQDFLSALDGLHDSLIQLKKHLNNIQHVILVAEKSAFCCFSLKDVIDNATGLRRTVNRQLVLFQILVDLRTYWDANKTLNTKLLLDHYIMKSIKPESELYLSKFIISLSHAHSGELLDAVAPTLKSNKLVWIHDFDTPSKRKHIGPQTARRCHAFYLDASNCVSKRHQVYNLPHAFSLENNHLVERIVINSRRYGFEMKLPRPSVSLIDPTLRSGLIELVLRGELNVFDLTQLNNGYFSNLAHLSIIGGEIKGHLDSQNVPCLRTLHIELGSEIDRSDSSVGSLVLEHAQSLIGAGRPWQLIATQDDGGWSLASYDKPTMSPQNDAMEGPPHSRTHSLPVIRELMLVARLQENINEWQLQLNGNPSPETFYEDQKDDLLMWFPECVQKITAFCTAESALKLEFKETIPGQTRMLTSLTCHDIEVVIDGAELPQLVSLEVNGGWVMLSGTFLQLQVLSFKVTSFPLKWQLNAPKLRSLNCIRMWYGNDLILRPQLLPHLSFLQIESRESDAKYCPTILFDENSSGLSQVKHVVFGYGMTYLSSFNQYQVHRVSHLGLNVDAFDLPTCWENTEWQCETLAINFFANRPEHLHEQKIILIKTPPLPLVKKLTVTEEEDCGVLLDSEMPNLRECAVTLPRFLGPNLKCPALRCIRYTGQLSKSDKQRCLDPATYEAMSARPKLVYFDYHGEVHRMVWNMAPSAAAFSCFI